MQEVLAFKALDEIKSDIKQDYSISDLVKRLNKDFSVRITEETRILGGRKYYTLKAVTGFAFKENVTESEAIFFLKGMHSRILKQSKFSKVAPLG